MMKTSLERQIRVMIPASLYSFLIAIHYAWTTANLEYFRSDARSGPFSDTEISIVTSMLFFGRLLAAITEVFLPVEFGRKTHFIVSALLMMVGSLVFLSIETVLALSIARFVIGFGIGLGDLALNMYVGETVCKKLRGAFISLTMNFTFCLGIMSTFVAPAYFAYDNILLMVLAFNVLQLLCTFDLIESPYFLLMNGQTEKALHSLQWLNDFTSKQAEEELKIISDHVDETMTVFDLIRNFRKPEIYKTCCIAIVVGSVLTLLSTVTNSFASLVFPRTESISSRTFAVGFTGLIALASLGSSFVVDRYGRRALLLWGLTLQTIAQASIALLYCLHDNYDVEFPYFAWLMFAFITATFLLQQFACSVPYGVVRGEIFPTSCKSIAVGMNIISNSLTNTIFSYCFLPTIATFGLYFNFVIFSVACLLGLIVVSKLLPETKGKSLIEIQLMLLKI